MTEIPKGNFDSPAPCWIPASRYDNQGPAKPLIKCNCGKVCGIGLHHVHADGTVTDSFFHANVSEFMHNGKKYFTDPGCDWHVWLKLLDYDCGEFPSVP